MVVRCILRFLVRGPPVWPRSISEARRRTNSQSRNYCELVARNQTDVVYKNIRHIRPDINLKRNPKVIYLGGILKIVWGFAEIYPERNLAPCRAVWQCDVFMASCTLGIHIRTPLHPDCFIKSYAKPSSLLH